MTHNTNYFFAQNFLKENCHVLLNYSARLIVKKTKCSDTTRIYSYEMKIIGIGCYEMKPKLTKNVLPL